MTLSTFSTIIFWSVQASAITVLFVPFAWPLVALCVVSHFARAIGLTLAFHRYYAHRSFKMNRVARFVWTFLGTAAMQKGPLWWAGHHVTHHRYSDRDGDPHSPLVSGFYYAHVGWFLNDLRHEQVAPSNPVIRDFSRFWEIRLIDRFHGVPPLLWAVTMYLVGGFPWLAWGFCLPTVTLAHATFAINTINHLFGSRRFETADESRNNVVTAILAAGEGWHNNHHRYQRAARNGFYWWEFDPTYYAIRIMGWLRLAWDIQGVPSRIYQEAERLALAPRGLLLHLSTPPPGPDLPGPGEPEAA